MKLPTAELPNITIKIKHYMMFLNRRGMLSGVREVSGGVSSEKSFSRSTINCNALQSIKTL
jgi:hypothetical protein